MVQVAEGRVGRIFFVRVHHGEDLLAELAKVVRERGVRHGTIQLLGDIGKGLLVTGPEEAVLPPVTHMEELSDGWELLAFGTIHPRGESAGIHLHTTAGRGRMVLTGCLREASPVYIVIEAVITEVLDIVGEICPDPTTGMDLPDFSPRRV